MKATTILFDINAGRYEGDEKNYKYCDSTHDANDALALWHSVQGYDFAELDVIVQDQYGRTIERINLLGGSNPEQWMRMRIASLWMIATQHDFVDLNGDWEQQLEDIEEVLNKSRPMKWQEVYEQFRNGLLTWTEAFQALMCRCGYSIDDALRCLAENFDRRDPVTLVETEA